MHQHPEADPAAAAAAQDAVRRAARAWLEARRRHGRDSAEDQAAEAAYLLLQAQAQDEAMARGARDLLERWA